MVINGSNIGHSNDLDLITLADSLVSVNGNLNLSVDQIYQIDNSTVLSKTGLGTTVISSSLTSVGILNQGSISSGFGSINTGSSTIETLGKGIFGELEVDNLVVNGNKIGHKNDSDLIEIVENHLKINGNLIVTGTFNQSTGGGGNNSSRFSKYICR